MRDGFAERSERAQASMWRLLITLVVVAGAMMLVIVLYMKVVGAA